MNGMLNPKALLDEYCRKGVFPQKVAAILEDLIPNYLDAVRDPSNYLAEFIEMAAHQIQKPYRFEPFHKKVTSPYNHFEFAVEFIRPLIEFEKSKVLGLEYVEEMITFMKGGGNVILYANHQTEPDPQIIYLLLEKKYKEFAQNMIFVAGHRVTTDPLAIPFSMGTDLLCIYSKRHIENPPEKKEEKLTHNKQVMSQMKRLLTEGSKCIYVAPSGGRDRADATGKVDVAPFDPNSVEMFRLMAKSSHKDTRFYPLALWTYPLMPPPSRVEKELHEIRQIAKAPVYMTFGKELEILDFSGNKEGSKQELRAALAEKVWNEVNHLYQQFDIGK